MIEIYSSITSTTGYAPSQDCLETHMNEVEKASQKIIDIFGHEEFALHAISTTDDGLTLTTTYFISIPLVEKMRGATAQQVQESLYWENLYLCDNVKISRWWRTFFWFRYAEFSFTL